MRTLETQIRQLATSSHTRIPSTIPSDTVPNPKGKEQCKAVKLRSGKELESPIMLDAQNGPNILHAGPDKLLDSQTSLAGADEGSEWATTEAREGRQEKERSTMSDIRKKNPLSPAMDLKSPFNFPNFIPPPPFPSEKKKRKKIIQEKGLDWMVNIIRKVCRCVLGGFFPTLS